MSIRLPRLLDRDLRETARLHPGKVTLTLDVEPLSTASMELPPGEPAVNTGDWVELFIPGRSAGIFRADNVRMDYVTGAQSVHLEHGLAAIGDAMVPGVYEFTSWNEEAPNVAITGYAAIQEKSNEAGDWFGINMTVSNLDGSTFTLHFKAGIVVPVSAVTEQGWRIPISQTLIDSAYSMAGTWDGHAAAGLISSNVLMACQPYIYAMGTTLKNASRYHRSSNNYTNREGMVAKDTRLTIHGRCVDSGGNGFYAVAFQESNGRRVTTFLHCEDVALDPDWVEGAPTAELPNQFQSVAGVLFGAAHKQDTGWAFGESDFSECYSYRFENVNLLDALLSLPRRLQSGYYWETDQSSLPWRLNLRRVDENCLAELRMGRNLNSLNMTVDAADVLTAVLPLGKNGLTVESINDGESMVVSQDGDTAWQAEALLQTGDDTPQALYEAALMYLNAHRQPAVSITVSALELSEMTGEPLDALKLGKLCRVPLPQRGVTVTEMITRLCWSDLYGEPERVTVTLANRPDTASAMLADLMRK